MYKDIKVFECYGDRASVTVKQNNDKLKFLVHDFGGWIFDTKNIVVALYVLRDKTIKNLKTYSEDNTKIVDILDNSLEYDKQLILDSLEDGGDLQWISWLTGNFFDYGSDKECIYDTVLEDLEEQGYSDDNEEDLKFIDNTYCDLIDKYDSDKILESMKKHNKNNLISIINSCNSYSELASEIKELSDRIFCSIYEYIIDFIYENKAY